MRLETNEITRKWAILHKGRKFHVKYSESDEHPSGLFNGKNWCVLEETDKETKELNVCVSHGDAPEHWKQAQGNALLKQKLVNFCMVNWDNRFTKKIRKKLQKQIRVFEIAQLARAELSEAKKIGELLEWLKANHFIGYLGSAGDIRVAVEKYMQECGKDCKLPSQQLT